MKSLPIDGAEKSPAIGARLRNHRLRQHMTMDQLAEASGLTKGFISRVERDQTSPSVASLLALCSVLRVDVGALFEEPETVLVTWDDAPAVDLGGEGIVEKLISARNLSKVQFYAEKLPRADAVNRKSTPLIARWKWCTCSLANLY